MLPIVRNTLIRLVAFFERVLRGTLGGVKGLFGLFSKLLGLDASYYVDGDAKSVQSELPAEKPEPRLPAQAAPPARRPTSSAAKGDTDYFRNMARQIRNEKKIEK